MPDPLVVILAKARREQRIPQWDLAERLGTRQSAISESERGITVPSLATFRRWAEALGYDVSLTKPEA